MLLHLGTTVHCTDGEYGELADLVLQPGSRQVTHLVVAPRRHHDQARLAPLALVGTADREPELALGCTLAEAHALPEVEEYAYVRVTEPPPVDSAADMIGIETEVSVPAEGYGSFQFGPWDSDPRVAISYDRIPRGEVEVRQESQVTDADGERIGRLDGVEIDEHGTITRVVLERAHHWGRRRVTVPADAVAHFDMDGVTLALTKPQIEQLAPTRS